MAIKNKKILSFLTNQFIAICAFLLSSLTFYYQFFWEDHKIYIAIMESTVDISKTEFEIVILNEGNKSEYIHKVKIIYSENKNLSNELFIYTCNKNPIHIKPSEKTPRTFTENKGSGNLEVPISSDSLYIGLEFDFLKTDGFTHKFRTLVAEYSFPKNSGNLLTERIEIDTE